MKEFTTSSGVRMVPQKCQQQQKGKPPTPIAAPPPVRESSRQAAAAGEGEREAAMKRDGYQSTVRPRRSLLNQGASDYNQPGSRSLL